MIPDMIPLVGEHLQVCWMVVLAVSVFMVDNMARQDSEIVGYNGTSDALAMSVLIILAFLFAFNEQIITVRGTEHVFSGSYLTSWPCYILPASTARRCYSSIFRWFNAVALECLHIPCRVLPYFRARSAIDTRSIVNALHMSTSLFGVSLDVISPPICG